MAVVGATNAKADYDSLAKEDGRMCTVFKEIARESEVSGEARGELKGEIRGRAYGIISIDIIPAPICNRPEGE